VLEKRGIEIKQLRSVRKEPFSDKEIRALLRGVSTVIISKGKKSTKLAAGDVKPADLKGPTGNYRSPIVRRGKTLLVGFNQEALEKLV
jgi:arsenate reductase-like glutaredoxin family protein